MLNVVHRHNQAPKKSSVTSLIYAKASRCRCNGRRGSGYTCICTDCGCRDVSHGMVFWDWDGEDCSEEDSDLEFHFGV